jgi:hypothetical protein
MYFSLLGGGALLKKMKSRRKAMDTWKLISSLGFSIHQLVSNVFILIFEENDRA